MDVSSRDTCRAEERIRTARSAGKPSTSLQSQVHRPQPCGRTGWGKQCKHLPTHHYLSTVLRLSLAFRETPGRNSRIQGPADLSAITGMQGQQTFGLGWALVGFAVV